MFFPIFFDFSVLCKFWYENILSDTIFCVFFCRTAQPIFEIVSRETLQLLLIAGIILP